MYTYARKSQKVNNLIRVLINSAVSVCNFGSLSYCPGQPRWYSRMATGPMQDDVTKMVRQYIPQLSHGLHKGQCGRIGIIGGSEEYTGAPYFAAITALKVGADLAHVFCCRAAAPVIKSYSPELIVHPILDDDDAVRKMREWIPRLHSVVIGPGLGTDPRIIKTTESIMLELKKMDKPLVIDADGLFVVISRPDIVTGYKKTILTPNLVEFGRLRDALKLSKSDGSDTADTVALSNRLGGLTVVRKGYHDVIACADKVLVVPHEGSPRRCGGQGDLLSGAAAVFQHWILNYSSISKEPALISCEYGSGSLGAYAACLLSKACASAAFGKHGRSTTTTDLINEIHPVFSEHFEYHK